MLHKVRAGIFPTGRHHYVADPDSPLGAVVADRLNEA